MGVVGVEKGLSDKMIFKLSLKERKSCLGMQGEEGISSRWAEVLGGLEERK